MSRAKRATGLALAALLLLGAGWWFWPVPASRAIVEEQDAEVNVQPATPSPEGAPTPAHTPTLRADAPSSALPAESLPLSQRLAELQRWSDAGHPEASCRLAIERMRCRMLRARPEKPGPSAREERLEEEGNLEAANAEAEAQLLRLEQAAACREANPGNEVGALALLAPAAAAGHAPSQVLYFSIGKQFRFQRGIYQHPGFDAWRRDAARHLYAAAQAGEPEAASALARALGNDSDLGDGLVPDDPRAAYVQRVLADRLFGRETHPSWARRAGIGEPERRRLEAEAARLHQERFAGRRFRDRQLDASAPHRLPALSASDFCGPPIPL
ncbi:hypothetical protein [Arenimonas sp.]|uniref:hypothetical protein n=1 Tax=Arenimonas sp. TaxID=1872635 RepID=UPI0035AE3C48